MNLFELFAKITLDTKDYEDGIDKSEKRFGNFGEKVKTGFSNLAKVTAVGLTATAAAAGALTKIAVDNFSEYEQLVGGVETLFKNSANEVKKYADMAYKTAGLSANDYMSTVTSFSASLLQSLGGDTEKAAKYADRAVIDMADNANKMGTSIEMIQNAYQGFAKQNYTMLDNLKLGYGGTKTEMERLLADAEKISGMEFDISSFADVTEAIHIIQENMGIAGTTALEAEETIQGSLSAAKAAFTNFTIGLADENANTEELLNELVDSIVIAGKNIIPKVGDILNNIIKFTGEQGPVLLNNAINYFNNFLTGLTDKAPEIVDFVINFFTQLVNIVIEQGPDILFAVVDLLAQVLQAFVDKGLEAGKNLIDNIKQGISDAWQGIVSWFNNLWDGLFGNRSVNVSAGGVNGSHANGLDYVPFDGYIAELHKGEKVLTASEAAKYRGGAGDTSFGDIIINIDAAKYSDEQSLAAAVAQEIQNMADRRSAVYA